MSECTCACHQTLWYLCRCWFCKLVKHPTQQLERIVGLWFIRYHEWRGFKGP